MKKWTYACKNCFTCIMVGCCLPGIPKYFLIRVMILLAVAWDTFAITSTSTVYAIGFRYLSVVIYGAFLDWRCKGTTKFSHNQRPQNFEDIYTRVHARICASARARHCNSRTKNAGEICPRNVRVCRACARIVVSGKKFSLFALFLFPISIN